MPKPVAVPDNAEDLRDLLTDPDKIDDLVKSGTLPEIIDQYVDLSLNKDKGLVEGVQAQFETFMINWLREHEVENVRGLNLSTALDARGRAVGKNTLYNKDAMGAKYDNYFNSVGDFFHSISNHSFKDGELSKKLSTLKNDLSSVKPSDGGYLIPETLRAQLLQVALEESIVRSRAFVVPMDSLSVPFPTVDSTSNVSSVYGGITGYWTEEGATLTESQPRFGRVQLTAHKLTLYTEVPSELMQDARPSMNALLDTMLPRALAWFEDVAFFLGNGVGEPLGFLNAPAMVQATRTAGGAAVEWADIANMYARMLPQSLRTAVWIISPDVLPSLLTMVLPGGTSPVIIGGGSFATGAAQPSMSMLGIPIVISEKARVDGTSGDINLVDFGFYLIGDRQAISARQSEDFRFQSDVTAFRVIERVDGRPWLASAVTPQNNGDTLSPFVQLT